MCEILLTRGGGSTFERSAYQGARDSNPDGAGFVLFDKGVDGKWEVSNMGTFGEKEYSYHGYQNGYRETYAPTNVSVQTNGEWNGWEEWEDDEDWKTRDAVSSFNGGGGYQKSGQLYLPNAPKKEKDTCVSDLWEMNEDIEEDQLLITHFRMATSGGVVEHNTHPIVEGDYLVIHNGIFGYTELPVGKSDTRKFTELLKDEAKRLKIKTVKEEQRLIERLLNEAGGYYSIFVYSWRTGELYYYKSQTASFYWNTDGSLGATRFYRFPIECVEAVSTKM